MKTTIFSLLFIAFVFASGYYLGRTNADKEIETKTTIEYVSAPYPVEIEIPIEKLVPYKVEVHKPYPVEIEPQPVDTLAILSDYLVKRGYMLDFSSDELGKFMVDVEVQENKIISAHSTIQPNTRVETIEKTIVKRPNQFYIKGGTSFDFNTNKIEFGIDLKQKYLFGVSGIRMRDDYGYTVDIGFKF